MSAEFKIKTGRIVAIDPCYSDADRLAANIPNVLNGTWTVDADISDEGSCGKRVAIVTIAHEDHLTSRMTFETFEADCGVDSGQFGFFDGDLWDRDGRGQGDSQDKASFYGQCCDITLGTEQGGVTTIVPGYVSSSGFGDGGYPVEVARNTQGQVIGVRVTFIGEDDDEDEDETCFSCEEPIDFCCCDEEEENDV